jgi:hypothetical protein
VTTGHTSASTVCDGLCYKACSHYKVKGNDEHWGFGARSGDEG